MAELKTKPTKESVKKFLDSVEHPKRAADAKIVLALMKRITGLKPVMWGPSIVGFGTYHYKYDSGREGDYLITGFSPRKAALTLYIMPGFSKYEKLMKRLGKHKTSVSCLYIKKLEDVDMDVLEELISKAFSWMVEHYGS